MSKEAMKLALEVLKINLTLLKKINPYKGQEDLLSDSLGLTNKAITTLEAELAEQPAQQDSTCSNALRIQHKPYPRTCKKCGLGPCVELAQQALDKMAENARELGLDYEPVQDGGIVTAGGFDPRTRRTWVGLTDEEANKIYKDGSTFGEMMRMVEAKLKEKNNG